MLQNKKVVKDPRVNPSVLMECLLCWAHKGVETWWEIQSTSAISWRMIARREAVCS